MKETRHSGLRWCQIVQYVEYEEFLTMKIQVQQRKAFGLSERAANNRKTKIGKFGCQFVAFELPDLHFCPCEEGEEQFRVATFRDVPFNRFSST